MSGQLINSRTVLLYLCGTLWFHMTFIPIEQRLKRCLSNVCVYSSEVQRWLTDAYLCTNTIVNTVAVAPQWVESPDSITGPCSPL